MMTRGYRIYFSPWSHRGNHYKIFSYLRFFFKIFFPGVLHVYITIFCSLTSPIFIPLNDQTENLLLSTYKFKHIPNKMQASNTSIVIILKKKIKEIRLFNIPCTLLGTKIAFIQICKLGNKIWWGWEWGGCSAVRQTLLNWNMVKNILIKSKGD